MGPERPRGSGFTRRAFVAAVTAGACAGADQINFPPEWERYADPATEFDVLRLTDPAHPSRLPPSYSRTVSKRSNFLLFTSDRGGGAQVCRLDLKNGAIRQLTSGPAVGDGILALLEGDRSFCYAVGGDLHVAPVGGGAGRQVASVGGEISSAAASLDGLHAAIAAQSTEGSLLHLADLRRGGSNLLARVDAPVQAPQPRPARASVLYQRGDAELWLVNYDGKQNRKLPVQGERVASPMWSADGRVVIYLSIPADRKVLNTVREINPDTGFDQPVAPTSQFASLARNADASVFVGASASKASPHVLLLLRVNKRELTLAEHKATDPALTSPVFAPNSQRIFFQSDRHGNNAIYSVNVERLVEKTLTGDDDDEEPPKPRSPIRRRL